MVSTIAGLVTVMYVRRRPLPHRLLLYADGLGLVLFTILGTGIAESTGVTSGVYNLRVPVIDVRDRI